MGKNKIRNEIGGDKMFNIVIDKESITDNNSSSAEKTAEWRSYKDILGTHCY